MEICPDELSNSVRYNLLSGLVVPRPIAWVSSCARDGTINLAPFSYFNIVGHAPMAISISVIGRKPDGSAKDTGRNLMPVDEGGSGAFVVNLVSEHQVAAMAKTARPLTARESEFTLAGLKSIPARCIGAPRVAGAFAALECRTLTVVPVGSSRLFVAEVVHIAIDDRVIDENHHIDYTQLAAIGRMAGSVYSRTTDRFSLPNEDYFPAARAAR